MSTWTTHRHIAQAALFFAGLAIGPPAFAQTPIRASTPGTVFSPEGRGAAGQDVAGGRRFRGKPGEKLMLRGVLRMPPASRAEPKMQRLVVHFRASTNGPSLRSVALLNGSKVEFRIETLLKGDYTTQETAKPDVIANAWAWERSPIPVSAQSVIRLEVQFPVGFDSAIDPGEFVLTEVVVDFPRKPLVVSSTTVQNPESVLARAQPNEPGGRAASPPTLPVGPNAVIYALANNAELLWYGHSGWEAGSFTWATSLGQKVGTGWGFKHVFPGDGGVIYAVTSDGDLLWYRHDGRLDGTFRWAAGEGKKVGTGWNYDRVFSGGGGVIYAITASGDLLWFRHDGRLDGTDRWAAPKGSKVGAGWAFKHVFAGGAGVIYAVADNNDLLWFRHDGRGDGSFRWAAPQGKQVGTGWAVKHVFSSGGGVIYAIAANDALMWYRHDGRGDGTFRWGAPQGKQVGAGWAVKDVFSGATLEP